MSKILLDTNAYTNLMTGDTAVLDILSNAETVIMSVIVLGELLCGFKRGTKERQNKNRLDAFLEKPTVKILPVSNETSEFFALVKHNLKTAGTPLPINDVWIAAASLESGALLVTFDSHFEKVAGLRVMKL